MPHWDDGHEYGQLPKNLCDRFWPLFWGYRARKSGPFSNLFNFRRIWRQAILITALVAVTPLVALVMFDYNLTRNTAESGIVLSTTQTVSNTWRTISFFLEERKSALNFLVHDNSFEELSRPERLAEILQGLKNSIGGFTDIGLIDGQGRQVSYVGPFELTGVDYSREEWFNEVVRGGTYVSEVYYGIRNIPHLVIAVCASRPDGTFFVLRATIDTDRFNHQLDRLELSGHGDAFLVNHGGVLQTPSRFHGEVFSRLALPMPEYSDRTNVFLHEEYDGRTLVIGYVYIRDSPFVLMIVKRMDELMRPWYTRRTQLVGFALGSVVLILLVILAMATSMVNHIFVADQERMGSLKMVEQTDKLASIGRLAAGVAHEINNPLAIINEKAGLLRDLFTYKKEYAGDTRLLGLADSIIASVERCGTITRRLLGFARHLEVSVQQLKLKDVLEDVLGFLRKEADYRSIHVEVQLPDDLPDIESDRGKLQQILLNIVNNAFQAMHDGGHLRIEAVIRGKLALGISERGRVESLINAELIALSVSDDGCGIPQQDIKRIYEPFFSTKTKSGGTGLGLSITYGLVRELQGQLEVE
ncbi:MAG: two-component sensor histidine kinase, partial [Desulfobulbaceae bacterium A2]